MVFGIKTSIIVHFEEIIVLMLVKFCEGHNFALYPNFGCFGHFWPISTIYILLSLFLKTEKNSKQCFLHSHVEKTLFYMPSKSQEGIGII